MRSKINRIDGLASWVLSNELNCVSFMRTKDLSNELCQKLEFPRSSAAFCLNSSLNHLSFQGVLCNWQIITVFSKTKPNKNREKEKQQ